ncbi:hypothetical protein D3H55_23180 [Bacillus salacetis]|uniref:Transcription elongation factor GreAB n=1 Tax=Bacillus salacetis TaxID=2315464 RepID=A0A3A1QNA6_9BACI|nr:hypothetical protein [Bacillus salacetis]RIW27286.1 hypothetical protein D3H55_23180 [Bacillus salacetis]
MKIKLISLVIISLQLLLAACANNSVDSAEYNGKSLEIGIVGDPPQVREENIKFTSIELRDIKEKKQLENFDAVFIMKEYLVDAANDEYVESYQSGIVPFFFIESEKSYLPFVKKSSTYEGSPDVPTKDYATGYYNNPKAEMQYWGYGLFDDIRNEDNIKDAYSRIFNTIEEIN